MSETGVYSPNGASVARIAERIEEAGIAPDPELFALFAKVKFDAPAIAKSEMSHYRRMMAAHLILIANKEDRPKHIRNNYDFISSFVGREISTFRRFREDLSDMNSSWRRAVADVLELYGDPDSETR